MKTETYQTHPKHVLKPNGLFEWERTTTDIECRCGHKQSSHLDSINICLDKSNVDLTGICICEIFALPNQTVSTFSKIPKKRVARKEQEQKADIIVKDGKITQDDQGKFMRQGII